VSSTYPAPLIFALGACHVLASSIFLNWNITLRTLLGFNGDGPFFKLFVLILFTGQILMPYYEALKAKYLFAVVACDLSLCFLLRFHNNIFAFGIRTELFQDTPHHFLVGFKLSKLFICCFIAHIFYKVIRYRRSAAALRTFNEQTFVS
jgi:hypothetical protein